MKNRKEAAFTTKFRPWAQRNLGTCAIEVKHTRGVDRFRTAELKEHQFTSLLCAAGSPSGILYKIPDDGRAYKPFDMVLLNKVKAYVVICYPKSFAVIPIQIWPLKKKSISSSEAYDIAEFFIPLSDL